MRNKVNYSDLIVYLDRNKKNKKKTPSKFNSVIFQVSQSGIIGNIFMLLLYVTGRKKINSKWLSNLINKKKLIKEP